MAKERTFNKFCRIGIILMLLGLHCAAQDPHFSQFYTTPLTQNPALAGAVYDLQANINYKNQWGSIANPFTTIAASIDMKFVKKRIVRGFWSGGLAIYKDDAGVSRLFTLTANLTLAYHIKLNQHNSLGAGLQGGLLQRSINFNDLRWGGQYNGVAYDAGIPSNEPGGSQVRLLGDCALGAVWSFNNSTSTVKINDQKILKWNLGVSVFHLNKPNLSFTATADPLYVKYVVHGDGLISIPNTVLALGPGFMISKQGEAMEILYGTLVRFGLQQHSKYTGFAKGTAFALGAFHRWEDAFILVMQLDLSGYRLGVSYDVNASQLRTATKGMGGFELSISYMRFDPFLNSKRR
jgi:type IX secretion system PorP/SprF family membrane protein